MTMMVRTPAVLAVLAAFVVSGLACHSSPPPAQPGQQGQAAQAAPPAATPRTGPTDDMSLLPIDSEVVFGINFSALAQSALWQKYVVPKLTTIDGLQKFKTLCGFDPLASLQSLALGFRDINAPNPTGMVVLHGFDRAKSMTCFDNDGVAEVQKDGTKVVIDGGFVMITDTSGKQVGFTFVDDKTAVAVIGPDGGSKESIEHATTGARGLATSSAFVEMYSQLNKRDSLWFLVRGGALASAAAMGIKPKAAFGSLNVTDGLTLDARVRLNTPDETKNLVSMAETQIANPQVKAFFDQLDVTAEGVDARFVVAMSEAKIATLVGMLGGAFGAAGGP
jgi:hypothetical protein